MNVFFYSIINTKTKKNILIWSYFYFKISTEYKLMIRDGL